MTMEDFGLTPVGGVLLLLVVIGLVFHALCVPLLWVLFRRPRAADSVQGGWPAVTVMKPIYGLEKNLEENLRSICEQDYPEYQVILSVQRLDDPAIPLLRKLEAEYPPQRLTIVVADSEPRVNGRVQNLMNAYREARHDHLVFTDSDVLHRPDYVRVITAPLLDPEVGCSNTLYRAVGAETWFEKLEQLTLTGDFIVNVGFAEMTGASAFCLGASTAVRRETLERIGGLEELAEYLVEDFEMGRRIWAEGLRCQLEPYLVDTFVDLDGPRAWWQHQVYWNMNTRAARPLGYMGSIVVRELPLALVFCLWRLCDPFGLAVLVATATLRLATMAGILRVALRDRETLRHLPWLLVRDVLEFGAFFVALGRRSFWWRGVRLGLTRSGRIVPYGQA